MFPDGLGRQRLAGALVLARLCQLSVVAVQMVRPDVLQLERSDLGVDAGEQVAVAGHRFGFHAAAYLYIQGILGVLLEGVAFYGHVTQFAVFLK